MDAEKTIQFLLENAAAHDTRMAAIEKALIALSEHQRVLQSVLEGTQDVVLRLGDSLAETQKSLRELGVKTDQRIASLTLAIAKFIEQRPS